MGTPSTLTIMLPLADELFCLVQASNCCAVGTKPTTPALEYPNAEDSTCLNVCLLIPVNPVLQYLNKKYVLKSASVPGTVLFCSCYVHQYKSSAITTGTSSNPPGQQYFNTTTWEPNHHHHQPHSPSDHLAFSSLCLFKRVLKLSPREDAKSHWLHFSPLCVFK